MQTRDTRHLFLLAFALAGACYDPHDEGEIQAPASTASKGEEGEEGEEGEGSEGTDEGGEAGGGQADGDPPPSGDDGPVCEDIGNPCELNEDCCEYESGGALCLTDEVNTLCHQTCDFPAECGSECCPALESGEHVCLPEVYCPGGGCSEPGESCGANGFCCGFADGDALCVSFSEGSLCAATCQTGSDCWSGCCVELDNGAGACAADYYCAGAPGGGSDPAEATPGDAADLGERMMLR